jgi:hypothetical protein
MRDKTGIRAASVLPDPVGATIKTLEFDAMSLELSVCIGLSALMPALRASPSNVRYGDKGGCQRAKPLRNFQRDLRNESTIRGTALPLESGLDQGNDCRF